MADRFLLLDAAGKKHLVTAEGLTTKVPGLGVIKTDALLASIGRRLAIGSRSLLVLTPSVRDEIGNVRRQAQIIAPKDAPAIVWNCDVKAGDFVLEAGAGSGALTIILARAVGPTGRVVSFDIRQDFLDVARENVTAARLASRVEFKIGDVRKGISEREADAFILDVPDPWQCVGTAVDALRTCGHFASFTPNVEQVAQTVVALRASTFVEVRTIEIIEREIEVRETGTHPSFAPLGHTGYLTFARKVVEKL